MIAIDIDPLKIEYAQHNAIIYEVDHQIDFMNGNFFHLAPKLKVYISNIVLECGFYDIGLQAKTYT